MTADELAELRHHWGDAYEIDADPWRASRRDDKGGQLTADNPEALTAKLRADYQREPVNRD